MLAASKRKSRISNGIVMAKTKRKRSNTCSQFIAISLTCIGIREVTIAQTNAIKKILIEGISLKRSQIPFFLYTGNE